MTEAEMAEFDRLVVKCALEFYMLPLVREHSAGGTYINFFRKISDPSLGAVSVIFDGLDQLKEQPRLDETIKSRLRNATLGFRTG